MPSISSTLNSPSTIPTAARPALLDRRAAIDDPAGDSRSPVCSRPRNSPTLPRYSYVGEQCIAASYRIPDELKRRVNGAVPVRRGHRHDPGCGKQSYLHRVAEHCYVAKLEKQFKNGQTFPDPGTNNHRGRGADHPGQWVKIGVRVPSRYTDESWG